MRNIVTLVDLDDADSWRQALPTAIDYAQHKGARLHVLTIVPDGMFKMTAVAQLIPADYEKRLTDDAKQRLAALIKKHAVGDLEIVQAVRMGSVYKEVLQYARDVEADLIIAGTHRPELKDYLMGPNVAQIVRHATCSVWAVRD